MYRIRTLSLAVVAALFACALVPMSALAIPRDVVVARGKVWVNAVRVDLKTGKSSTGVPYSQGAWALEDGSPVPTSAPSASVAGYRTDCSGFVSMCWNLRDSLGRPFSTSTYEMGKNNSSRFKIRQIKQAELQPGDALLKSTVWYPSGTGHVIIFAGWSKADMSEYWALEQTGPKTILHTRPYGQTGYRAFRFDGIEEDFSDCQERISGSDRYSTAAAAAEAAFPSSTTVSVPALVVASGENWPDALGGAGLSGAVGGPLLLTSAKGLPAATTAQIRRLKPQRVYVLGGAGSVSDTVERQIASLGTTMTVLRLGGPNRYDVAAAVARATVLQARASGSVVETAFVATGSNFPDALAASPLSAKSKYPILLTRGDALSPSAAAVLRELKIKNVVILGGPASVGPGVEATLRKQGYQVTRIADANRYSTALRIARFGADMGVGLSWSNVGVASGVAFADALSGGAAQGKLGSLLVLTPGQPLDGNARVAMVEHRDAVKRARVFGGIKTITQKTRAEIAAVLRIGQ